MKVTSRDFTSNPILTNFLLSLNKLKELELNAIDCDLMDFFTKAEFPFDLRRLSLNSTLPASSTNEPHKNEVAAMKFFTFNCVKTLQFIDIHAGLPHSVLCLCMTKMTKLKSLVLRLDVLPKDFKFNGATKKSEGLRELTLKGTSCDFEQALGVLKLYPLITVSKI